MISALKKGGWLKQRRLQLQTDKKLFGKNKHRGAVVTQKDEQQLIDHVAVLMRQFLIRTKWRCW